VGNHKVVGLYGTLIEIWKCVGKDIIWLVKLFNRILKSKKMPNEWRMNTLVPIYKEQRRYSYCLNYRRIKLISHTKKL